MGVAGSKLGATFGFLTVLENGQHGLFGGYLILNQLGRPLEFHCTAPVKANRAQQILYGRTLEPYLLGEQIGQTLVNKATIQPRLVCTDRAPVLALRDHVDLPVVFVSSTVTDDNGAAAADGQPGLMRPDALYASSTKMLTFSFGRHELALAASQAADRAAIASALEVLAENFDLAEPFGRIREAIEEAQRGTRQAA